MSSGRGEDGQAAQSQVHPPGDGGAATVTTCSDLIPFSRLLRPLRRRVGAERSSRIEGTRWPLSRLSPSH